MAGFLVAALVILCDQLSKAFIIAFAQSTALPLKLLPFFNLVLIFNRGVSFGMLAHAHSWIALLLPVCLSIITLMLVWWLLKTKERIAALALGLIIGGAIGNLIDRLRAGVVTDFLDFHIGDCHWPAFNMADSFIFIGVVIFVFTNIIAGKRECQGEKTV